MLSTFRQIKTAAPFAAMTAVMLTLLCATPARAEYTYIHNDGEYSVTLPDAPKGETIWSDQRQPIPFIKESSKFGSLGEVAQLRRTDAQTGDSFDVDIIFVKSGSDYLMSLTEENVREMLEAEYSKQKLERKSVSYSQGSRTLKWGTLTGFSVDRNNNLLFHACHILTGLETIMLVKVTFNAENEKFGDSYQTLKDSIKFVGTK